MTILSNLALLKEPAIEIKSPLHWSNWLLFAVICSLTLLEAQTTQLANVPILSILTTALVALCIVYRHLFPLFCFIFAFILMLSYETIGYLTHVMWYQTHTSAFSLILPYTLVRYASGKDIVLGFSILLPVYILTKATHIEDLTDSILGFVVLSFPAVLAAAMRFRQKVLFKEKEQIKLAEREQIARELHDSVAHHISAIVIQAQAALSVIKQSPLAVKPALVDIEQSSKQALNEMRDVLSALRSSQQAQFSPQKKISDIHILCNEFSFSPIMLNIELGNIEIEQSLSFSCYRIVQESLENTKKHSQNFQSIHVSLSYKNSQLQLCICDDGEQVMHTHSLTQSFGLIGIQERVDILNGQLKYGWRTKKGWFVQATFPLN